MPTDRPEWGFHLFEDCHSGYRIYACPRCHALVSEDSQNEHDAWHDTAVMRHGF